jgi:hypothetical protein
MVGSRIVLLGLAISLLPPVISTAAGADPSGAGREPGFIPAYVSPNGAVTERQLAVLAARLSRQFGSQTDHPVQVERPFAPVSRLRVIATLVKLGVAGDNSIPPDAAASEKMPPDAALIPAWGVRFVATAVEQGWWPSDRPVHAREVATWEFVKVVLERMMTSAAPEVKEASSEAAPPMTGAAPDPAAESYTGLILDARDLEIQRAMGPRILDEDGQVLYPDPNHVPDMLFLQDHGMAAYVKEGQDTPRSGSHPLTVPVVSITGPGHDDVVVSRETARQIREAAARDGFLGRWAVSILISPR